MCVVEGESHLDVYDSFARIMRWEMEVYASGVPR